jgi:hypothetical protein
VHIRKKTSFHLFPLLWEQSYWHYGFPCKIILKKKVFKKYLHGVWYDLTIIFFDKMKGFCCKMRDFENVLVLAITLIFLFILNTVWHITLKYKGLKWGFRWKRADQHFWGNFYLFVEKAGIWEYYFGMKLITWIYFENIKRPEQYCSFWGEGVKLCLIYAWSRCRSDRMVVGFTTIYAISAYRHWSCEFESRCTRYHIMW